MIDVGTLSRSTRPRASLRIISSSENFTIFFDIVHERVMVVVQHGAAGLLQDRVCECALMSSMYGEICSVKCVNYI